MILISQEVYSLKSSLNDFVDDNIAILQKRSDNAVKQQYDQLIADVQKDKSETLNITKSKINRLQSQLADNVKSWLKTDPESTESKMGDWLERNITLLNQEMTHDFESLAAKLQAQIEDLQVSLPQLSKDDIGKVDVAYQELLKENQNNGGFDNEKISSFMDKIDAGQVSNILAGVGTKISEQQIVAVLQLTKQYLPTLMKGIGIKTMEKMAATTVSKFVPLIGPIISIGMSLWESAKEESEAERIQRQIDEQNRQRERYYQQIDDTANQVAEQVSDEIRVGILKGIDDFFAQFMTVISRAKQAFTEQEQQNSQLLSSLVAVKQDLANV